MNTPDPLSTKDIITLVLAIYGAVLSSFLAVQTLRKEKRRLLIVLEHMLWSAKRRLILTNIGHRPITIIGINLGMSVNPHMGFSTVPQKAFFETGADSDEPPFPLKLQDGETASFTLSEVLNDELSDEGFSLKVTVFDSEGNQYTNYSKWTYDEKYGVHTTNTEKVRYYRQPLHIRLKWWFLKNRDRIFSRKKTKNEEK